jgi:hypothetical protein
MGGCSVPPAGCLSNVTTAWCVDWQITEPDGGIVHAKIAASNAAAILGFGGLYARGPC